MKVINLWAGPGAGKSTTAAGLFYLMKVKGLKVELVTEYAKDVVWEKHDHLLSDQLFITANQNRRLLRLMDHNIDYVVTDSPLLLGYQYTTPNYLNGSYEKLLLELWNSYDNINFFIERRKEYVQTGRMQTEEQAHAIDDNLKKFCRDRGIDLTFILGDGNAPGNILEQIPLQT